MATPRRKSANVYDYPEHLNPFHEEDNHNRLRFWAVTNKKSRSNSFSFQSIKDFRGSIRLPLGSRNRADTSSSLSQLNCLSTTPKNVNHTRTHSSPSSSQSHNDNRFYSTLRKLSRTFSIRNKNKSNSNGVEQPSQIENDVEILVRPSERLSVAPLPLPRSRFQQRVKNTDSVSSGSLNVDPDSDPDDKNPFGNDNDDQETEICKPVTPMRKKKKAPPPPLRQSSLKAKSLADYQAQKQNEVVSSTDHTETNINIEIKVEQVVANANEHSEENNTENYSNKEDSKVDTQTNTDVNKIEQDISPNTSEPNQDTVTTDNSNNEETHNDDIPNAESSINYNTEGSLQSFSSPKENVEDASDLLELVNKLQLEVEKLTDDTNNNVIETEEERKIRNMRSWIPLDKHKTEMNVNLDKHYQDDDYVVSAPMSPRLIRLRRDNDWIRSEQ